MKDRNKCSRLISAAKNRLPDVKGKLTGVVEEMRRRGLRNDAKVVPAWLSTIIAQFALFYWFA